MGWGEILEIQDDGIMIMAEVGQTSKFCLCNLRIPGEVLGGEGSSAAKVASVKRPWGPQRGGPRGGVSTPPRKVGGLGGGSPLAARQFMHF